MIRRAEAETEAGHQLPYLNMQFQFPKNTIPACNTQLTRPSCLPLDGQGVTDGRREFRGVGKRGATNHNRKWVTACLIGRN